MGEGVDGSVYLGKQDTGVGIGGVNHERGDDGSSSSVYAPFAGAAGDGGDRCPGLKVEPVIFKTSLNKVRN